MRTSIPKKLECSTSLMHCSDVFGGEINIENTYENILYGSLKKNQVIYHNEEKRVTI